MRNKPGFTLVEMLVAVALVVLMMFMFAQVFQTAGGLVSNQKGLAKNDQTVRTLTILLRGDMKHRTFRDVVPFVPGQNTNVDTGSNYVSDRREGFFSISENDPANSTDDVLHLTIASTAEDEDFQLPYSGRASMMFNGSPADLDAYLLANPDQPEFDDGQITVNNTGSSRFAEVCWFLRNGTLYRRKMLVRDPYNPNKGSTGEEPADADGVEFIDTSYTGEEHVPDTNPTGTFWRDFDYSAYWEPNAGLKFHTGKSRENRSNSESVPNLIGFPRSLGIPFLRFGSSVSRASSRPVRIFGPREFLDEDDPATFIGRFNSEESTHAEFHYPGNMTAGDPHDTPLTLNNGTVSEYAFADPNQRRGEDIMMANVHEFDIQVWDEIINGFVNIGHERTGTVEDVNGDPVPNVPGWYHRSRNRNGDFGNRYDTWHPFGEMPETPYAPFGDPSDSPNDERLDRAAEPNRGLGDDGEVPLRAVRIHIRFIDPGSDQMRDLTFTFTLK